MLWHLLFLPNILYIGDGMLGIVKGDIRYDALATMVDAKLSSKLVDFYGIDVLLLPFGGIDAYYNIKNSKLNILDILKFNCVKTIIVGNANNKLKDLCEVKNITLVELLKLPQFVIENAKLTSMGIIDFLQRKNLAIHDLKILIMGYGNIGYTFAELLDAYGCNFSIYPNTKEEEKYILLRGFSVTDWQDFDIVVNTIPANIEMDYEVFKNKRILDVASAPYGFDIDKIEEYGISYEIYSAIPSKFAYISAANIIKKYIEKFL